MNYSILDLTLRVVAGAGFGILIGVERQYRARMAGLRTNALVALGSALFVVLSASGFAGGDPTRVAAQIVSGIGFLGGGVILRDGLTVRGLNTAATLWCSAAVGALAGSGLYFPAALGTAAIIVVNTLLRSLGHVLDRVPAGTSEHPVHYEFVAVTDDDHEAHVRTMLVQALVRTPFHIQSVSSRNAEAGRVDVRVDLFADEGRDDRAMETAISTLSTEPAVTSVSWRAVDDDRADDRA